MQVPTHGQVLSQGPLSLNGLPSTLSSQEELLFFDKLKKALEVTGTYEEFLKLLNLFARDVIEVQQLVEQARRFLTTDEELMSQFKELVGWDDRAANTEFGPPDSIRTRPPDPQAPVCPDDGQGPSYRRLPEYVSHHVTRWRRATSYSLFD